jgi:protein-tyrosine phosphatase
MIPDIYEVTVVGEGSLYVMPRPNSEWLREDIKYFKNMGVNLVVSHLEISEEKELGLSKEGEILNEHGIDFVSYPIKDRNLPNIDDFREFVEDIYDRLKNGENVAIHCRAGIGRTGVMSSCLLIKDGYESDIAMDMVAAARGTQIPDTDAQFDFICEYKPRKT